ncbi:MAG: molybdopterin-dependent oxidoreductase [Dehalococcoidales bacterium]|nr:molybdopterin-dependent oxidoreductase [Dehalococcoidales bacterium]
MTEKEHFENGERIVTSACASHCGANACVVKLHVKNGVITRIETDDSEEPQLRACWRGRAYRQRIYAPDRLKFPLKRVGARGEGKFERIGWDEALDCVAGHLKRVKENYGPASILLATGGIDTTFYQTWGAIHRVLCQFGGCTRQWGSPSNEGGYFASLTCFGPTYGAMATRNTHDDWLNSRMLILWGMDPAHTVLGCNTCWYLARAKEKGIKIVVIDPKYSDTAAIFGSRWIPIIPGTDTAMMLAMAHTMITENLQDQKFLDTYTAGFDKFRDHVLGVEDGIPKTPAWAEAITSVPAATIVELAREYATSKPAALLCGISPGRTAYGEQYHRAAITLSAMTGNIGIHGGSSGGMIWAIRFGGYPFALLKRVGVGAGGVPNPVERGSAYRKDAPLGYGDSGLTTKIHSVKLGDAILKGKAGGYPADIKLLYILGAFPNQYPNIRKMVQAMNKLEFIVTHEQFMTPSAKFADIVFPSSSLHERNDVTSGHGAPPFIAYIQKVIEPAGESKSHTDIANALAARLGVTGLTDKTEDEWFREIVGKQVPDYETFKKQGFHKCLLPEPFVALSENIDDPKNHPFSTPSGKIEIYSQQIADMNQPKLPPIPKYIETWENRNDPLFKKYPLQLITSHCKRRAHSQYETVPWLREIEAHAMLISSVDAEARNIRDGDNVKVFNDRGETVIRAKVTERIMPGVVDVPEGAWYDPDEKGLDRGGSANVLTRDEPSPGGAFPYNTALVQVKKF